MSKFHTLLVISALASPLGWAGPGLDQAEVRLPYGELKSLITGAAREPASGGNEPALLSARFRLSIADGQPVVDAAFRTTSFADGLAKVPLVGGDVTVAGQKPQEARVIIRGLRAVSDFEFEFQMALMNRKLDPSVETVFLTPIEQFTYLSSRIIKEIAMLGGAIEEFVPRCVAAALRGKSRGGAA